jgi:CheY-like chemotaxis protein
MGTPRSIVVVEDECIAAEDIRRRLVSWGYCVPAVVATGEEAIRSAEQVQPDLVLMDIHLKGNMDGVEAAECIRARLHVPVIYATAHNDIDTMARAGVAGPFEMINKPYDDLEIRAAIELALTRKKTEPRLPGSGPTVGFPQRGILERVERPLHSLEILTDPLRK